MTDYDPRTATGIPTEPVGSLPRPSWLQQAYARYDAGEITRDELAAEQDKAVADTIEHLEATGAPIISDGEQRWSSFATYAIADTLAGTGLADHLAGTGGQYFAIFADGHNRQLPRLTGGPFRYQTYAADTLRKSIALAHRPMKQAVIAPSMLALLYPLDEEIGGYTQEQFGGLHRGTAGHPQRPAQPVDRPEHAAAFHRAEQPGDGAVHRAGADQDWGPHLSGR
jgi:hypothetical protein